MSGSKRDCEGPKELVKSVICDYEAKRGPVGLRKLKQLLIRKGVGEDSAAQMINMLFETGFLKLGDKFIKVNPDNRGEHKIKPIIISEAIGIEYKSARIINQSIAQYSI